jgi:hypothetical protein
LKNNFIKQIVVCGLVSLALFSAFLTPTAQAQTWAYDGADTEQIPHHSVYPSEWYVYNSSIEPQKYRIWKVTHGNISDFGLGNGYSVWTNQYLQNVTTGELQFISSAGHSSWNDTIGYQGNGFILPVENDGFVSQSILDNASAHLLSTSLSVADWEFAQVLLNPCSMKYWNETHNSNYLILNYTNKGVQSYNEFSYIGITTDVLISAPAQLPPDFSFTTEDGILDITTTTTKFNVSVTPADNNNDGDVDTDYQYRFMVDSTWSNWTVLSGLIDYSLSSAVEGDYQIALEVKNMYGVTQEQITVHYTPPPSVGDIPGYSTFIVAMVLLLGVSFLVIRHRRR